VYRVRALTGRLAQEGECRALLFYHTDRGMQPLFSSVYCIDSGAGAGQYNMDVDQQFMHFFSDGLFQDRFGQGCCLWRFYSWSPQAISLGRNQNAAEIDRERCLSDGVDVVVRPTGGRAVFHADELTYSFFAATQHPNEVIYHMVHNVIARALAGIGVVADFCRSQPDFRAHYASAASVPCFTASARYELQIDGRKIIGSAQRRRGEVILQHGSLPLSARHRRISRYIAGGSRALVDAIDADMERKTASLDEFTDAGYADLVPLFIAEAGAATREGARVLTLGDIEFFEGQHKIENFNRNQDESGIRHQTASCNDTQDARYEAAGRENCHADRI
jgi:lipoate-protein ligase A